jgi:hypothetical protein
MVCAFWCTQLFFLSFPALPFRLTKKTVSPADYSFGFGTSLAFFCVSNVLRSLCRGSLIYFFPFPSGNSNILVFPIQFFPLVLTLRIHPFSLNVFLLPEKFSQMWTVWLLFSSISLFLSLSASLCFRLLIGNLCVNVFSFSASYWTIRATDQS